LKSSNPRLLRGRAAAGSCVRRATIRRQLGCFFWGWGALLGASASCLLPLGCAPGANTPPAAQATSKTQLTEDPRGNKPDGATPPPPGANQPSLERQDPAQPPAGSVERAEAVCPLAVAGPASAASGAAASAASGPAAQVGGRAASRAQPAERLTACTWLGAYHASRGEQRQAVEYFRAACEGGGGAGCAGLGSVLMTGGAAVTGAGVLRDPGAARAAWARGCELNSGVACWLAAQDLARGGAGAAVERARVLRKKACDLEILEACSDAAR